MTSKERLMRALHGEKPDRLPVTIHQWQQYHLDRYMNGMDALRAFAATGMDAAIQYFEAVGQFWIPQTEEHAVQNREWTDETTVVDANPENRVIHHLVRTPGGTLTCKTCANSMTTWITEYLIKKPEDIEIIEKYMPVARIDKAAVAKVYDEIGDAGILRGFIWGDQAGCWQHACCLMEPQSLILTTMTDPEWVHRLLRALLERKLFFIEDSLRDAKFDIIENGGGSGSDTVISPEMHREFCMPYDRAMHKAIHDAGLLVTYHTCGGMIHILDLILENGADASETLSPPGTGGNIVDPAKVRDAYAGRIAMIGGMDQFNILTSGSKGDIHREVHRLFEGFGRDGGYIMAASDHFFDTSPDNLRAYAEAARECTY